MSPAVFVLILAGVLLIAGAVVLAASRRIREIDRYRCPRCGYELQIRPWQICPECGEDVHRRQLTPPTTERRAIWRATGVCLIFFGLLIGLWGAVGLVG
ncbi:MAG: hypothetical protein IT436_02115 [Phycisphaerales bacterium]|nr:hypothetical protein [Phycisphaerales bacterium]